MATADLDGQPVVVSGSGDRDGAGVGPGHRRADRHPHRPHGLGHAVAIAELDGRPVVISGSSDGTVRVWDLATGAPVGDPFAGHPGRCSRWRRLSSRAGRWSSPAAATRRCGCGTWPPAPRSAPSPATRAGAAVAAAELEGRPVVISGGGDGTVRVWDLATGDPVGVPFAGHTEAVVPRWRCAELEGRPVIIVGVDDETVRVWDLATGALIGTPPAMTGTVLAVAVGELEGRPVIISGGGDRDGAGMGPGHRRAYRPPLPATRTRCTRWRPPTWTGRPVVISGSGDQTVRVWDLATGNPIGTPLRHGGSVSTVTAAWLERGIAIISGGPDQRVRVWGFEVTIHCDAPVLSVAWPELRSIVIGTHAGIVTIDPHLA